MPDYEYAAFVSYRHLDATEPGQQWAAWVQTLLERYTTPPELAGQQSLYGDPVPDKMERVFRDKDQLPAHGDLGALIHDALEKSRVLIVLCTPNAVASPWVADEILHFKKLGRADRIIAIVLRGEPHAPDPRNECYPPPLRHKLHTDGTVNPAEKEHPIYIDLRPPLGTTAATSPEDYRAVLHAADLYKDGPIEAAVTKYTSQLEEARILLLGGVLGLTPRELTQRDLLRRIEEEKTRAAEEKKRAEWEAEQKHIAETARAEAVVARIDAELAREQAGKARDQAERSLLLAEQERAKAEEARVQEHRQRTRATAFSKAAVLAILLVGLFATASYIQRERAIAAREKATRYRNESLAAELKETNAVAQTEEVLKFVGDESSSRSLNFVQRLEFANAIKESMALYDEQHSTTVREKESAFYSMIPVADTYQKIARIYNADGEQDAAIASYKKSLMLFERIAQHYPSVQVDIVGNHQRIGDIQKAKGEQEAALASYEKGFGIAARLANQFPDAHEAQNDLSVFYSRIADIQMAKGERESALVGYQKSLEITERVAKQLPGNARWQSYLSGSHTKIGDLQIAEGKREAALTSYQKSLEIADRVAIQAPDNADWHSYVAESQSKIGDIQQAKGEWEAALASNQKSLQIRERLAKQEPGNAKWQRDVSMSHINIGNIQQAKAEREAALASFRKSLEIAERLATLDGLNALWQVDVVNSQARIAFFHLDRHDGDTKEAARLVREGMQRLDELEKRIQPDLRFNNARAALLLLQSQLPKGQ